MAQSGSTNALAKVLETRDPSMLVPGGYPPVVDRMLSPTHSNAMQLNTQKFTMTQVPLLRWNPIGRALRPLRHMFHFYLPTV